MTFSIVGRSKDGKSLGVAVASKFLAVGAYVPAAAADAGAIATQAYGNLALKTKGLELLAQSIPAADMLQQFLESDGQKEERQIGVVDAAGRVATFTGNRCQPWAGGRAEQSAAGSYAAQGNMLAGAHVVDAMVDAWTQFEADESLASRLVKSIAAGQAAGGDPRGKQAAAVLVVSKSKGYGGLSDVVVDLRCDDSPEPIEELQRMLNIHELYFGTTPADKLLAMDGLIDELRVLLKPVGYDSGDIRRDLYDWMGRENFEERWHDDAVDPVVLEQLRSISAKA
jgi:uncharacterized Ntn-hydrolase superfamily protein